MEERLFDDWPKRRFIISLSGCQDGELIYLENGNSVTFGGTEKRNQNFTQSKTEIGVIFNIDTF